MKKEQIEQVLKKYPSLKLRTIYKHAITGFSVSGEKRDVAKLQQESFIQAVTEIAVYHAALDESVPFIGGDQVRGVYDSRKQRITGKGIKVGVIDTGIDYTHPDLKHAYKGGKDLVDHDNDPMETRGNPELATIHGTHVAGIIAANGKVKGVAPEAEIYAYRALGPGGSGDTEQVLLAIDAAIEDGVDVLNLSLGNEVNGPDLPISLALNKAVDQGIVAVTSNGNSGPAVWTVGSPGTSEKAISVGASTPPMKVPYLIYGLGTEKQEVSLLPVQGAKEWSIASSENIVDGGLGERKELKGVQGKIVLIQRGKLSFLDKVKNAKKAGAKAVIIFNNTKGSFTAGLGKDVNLSAATIPKKDGERIKRMISNKEGRTVSFVYRKEQDRLADFSSRGPVTVSWDIKPDILAPGVGIYSTIPNGYTELAGTSMSAPHVAGACALLLQAHPNWTPNQIKSALMTTAKPLKNKSRDWYHTFEQGAGRLQIAEALKADTLLYPSSLSFGMYTRKEGIDEHQEEIVVENTGPAEQHYSFHMPLKEPGITWDLPTIFTVQPGEKKKLMIGLQINPSEMKKGVYDGYLILMEGTRKINLPFLYVKEEPDYPRIMGFEFGQGDKIGTYRYEMYLPRGADEFGIALYDADSLAFVGFMDWKKAVPPGLIKREVKGKKLPPSGIYKAIIFAKRGTREDRIETMIHID
ncbi:S8 family serine peptidase [Peribacillus asahii]|nr:S8 family serine peptidase [Peribacillus asahii]